MVRRLIAFAAPLALVALATLAPDARAAAEVHKFNLVLSVMPSEIHGGDFNKDIDYLNDVFLEPVGLKGLDRVTYGWLFGAEARYFVRSNWTLDAGIGQLRNQTKREYLPALQQAIEIREEVLSVPFHAGASYYFAPYNQGDFQARAFLGGGLLSHATNRVTQQISNTTGSGAGSSVVRWSGATPGFYGEGGVHMFFASRFSVILSANYRDAKSTVMVYTQADPSLMNTQVDNIHAGTPYVLDAGGLGFRMAVGIGL
jgi:hypothetical protein